MQLFFLLPAPTLLTLDTVMHAPSQCTLPMVVPTSTSLAVATVTPTTPVCHWWFASLKCRNHKMVPLRGSAVRNILLAFAASRTGHRTLS